MKYQITDFQAPLLDDYGVQEAATAKLALKQFIEPIYGNGMIQAGYASQYKQFKTTPFEEVNGQKIKKGRDQFWYFINASELI